MATTIDESYIPDIDYDDDFEEGGNRRVIFLALIVVVVLLVGALAYWFLVMNKGGKQTLGTIERTTDTYDLGQQTMNLGDGALIQVDVKMHLTTLASKGDIGKDSAALTNAEILVFGQATSANLLTATGKQAVQQQLVAHFNQILGLVDKLPQVQGIYFGELTIPQPVLSGGSSSGGSGSTSGAVGGPLGGGATTQ